MIDQSVGLKFRTFEILYKYSIPSLHGFCCFSPWLELQFTAPYHHVFLGRLFQPHQWTPQLSGKLRTDTPNAHEPRRWFHDSTRNPQKNDGFDALKKNGKAFFGVKLKNWPMAAKELQPPATNLPRFITKHWGIQKLCHWNLCCQQHDHMTTWHISHGWINKSLCTTASSVNAGPSPLGFDAFELDWSLDLDSQKWHLHFCLCCGSFSLQQKSIILDLCTNIISAIYQGFLNL